jgi:hypothetical protein
MYPESSITKRILSQFPENLGFIDNQADPLHLVIDAGSDLMDKMKDEFSRKIDNLSIDKANPGLPMEMYKFDLSDKITNMNDVRVEVLTNGGAVIVDREDDFFSDTITGFDYEATITPVGISPSGIVGISYGFDWDDPALYVSVQDSRYVYVYTDLTAPPDSMIDYAYVEQSYEVAGYDEYLQFEIETAVGDILPSGIAPGDDVKVAYLKHEPIGNVRIIDALNTYEPNNEESDGIVVSSVDYVVDEDKVLFSPVRSDYNPAILTDVADGQIYTYPENYQPDRAFDSAFIIEYTYELNSNPRYIANREYFHNLRKKGKPDVSS